MSDYYFSIPLYHVDLKENNELFIEGEKIPPSNEDGEWGGKGLYLWDNLKNAEYWKKVHWKNDQSKASIVKTVLRVQDSKILDLTEPMEVKKFEESLIGIAQRAKNSKNLNVAKKANYILKYAPKGYAINYYSEYLETVFPDSSFKVVRLIGLYPSVNISNFFKDDLVLNKYYNKKKNEQKIAQKYFVPHVTIQSKMIYVVKDQELLIQREICQED